MLKLYDAPLYRDWAFWMTIGWGVLGAVPTTTGEKPDQTPWWFNALIIGGILGVFPTWLRLLFRKLVSWNHARLSTRRELFPQQHPQLLGPLDRAYAAALPQQQARVAARFAASPHATAAPASSAPAAPAPAPEAPAPSAPAPSMPASSMPPTGRSRQPAVPHQGTPASGSHAEGGDKSLYSSDMLKEARKSLPHPVARAVHTLQLAPTPKDQYEALLDAAETLAVTVSVTVAALLRELLDDDEQPPKHQLRAGRSLSSLRTSLIGRGTTFGTWTTWLDGLRPLLAENPELLPRPSTARGGEPDYAELTAALNRLRIERNRAAHGDKPKSQPESALRVTEGRFYLNRALLGARFLEVTPWLLTTSCTYEPRSGSFQVIARDATGDHPEFERQTFTWHRPVGTDMFYACTTRGPVLLAPFVARPFCHQCREPEISYPSRTGEKEGPLMVKSFGRGHSIEVPDLGDDIRALPH